MRIIGHDPGCTGGLVLTVDGEAEDWWSPRRKEGRLDAREVYDWLLYAKADVMVSEKVRAIPKDTPITAWAFAAAEAAVVSAAQIAGLRVVYVLPTRWQKAIFQRLPHADRDQRNSSAFAFARERHPAMSDVLAIAGNDGIAAAVCIAEYGFRLHKHKRL